MGDVFTLSSSEERPLVLVTYSHKDEAWKDKLLPHLRQYELNDLLEVWEDRQIGVGVDWYANINDVLRRTRCAISLISADFLSSRFCMFEEIPYLLQQRRRGNLEIFPILLRDCDWKEQRWLRRLQMLPRDGRDLVTHFANNPDPILKETAKAAREAIEPGYQPYRPESTYPEPETVNTDRLPETGALLFGRRNELKFLDDAWRERKRNVTVFRASGGVGKSTLVRCWAEELAEDNFLGAERVFAWSFYSQGTGDSEGRQGRVTSADEFIGEALDFFGDPSRGEGLSLWDRGQRLAERIREKRTLLLLDGMEPLQSSLAVQRGEITDPGLATLVQELARQNPGLCIISTREQVADLNEEELEERVAQIELETVSPLAGRALLRERGVHGEDEALEATVKAFGGHAFALQLLGRYLDFYGGSEIGVAGDIPAGDDLPEASRHARRVMAAFAKKFGEASAEVQLLRVLGLFDRPAERGAIDALRAEPPIAGLTDRLVGLEQSAWTGLLDRLRASGLVAPESHHAPDEIDAHPLIREHFGAELRQQHPDAWREGHGRLYEYFRDLPEKHQPDTLEEMAPLFQAVFHGCRGDRYQESYKVYMQRIHRDGRINYCMNRLGAPGADTAAISNFFDLPWTQVAKSFAERDRAALQSLAGFRLRALGRPREAIKPMEAGLEMAVAQNQWIAAAVDTINLSELHLTLGEMAKAVARAEEGVRHADQSGDWQWRVASRSTLATAIHHKGDREPALALFEEAEALHAACDPKDPRLYSLWGFHYCDLLLDLGRPREVRERAEYALQIAKKFLGRGLGIHDIGHDHLSLGRAELVAWQAGRSGDLDAAEEWLGRAVEDLQQAGQILYLPRGLLARAALFRRTEHFDRARRDLDEVRRIAKRSQMRLFQCDVHLEAARLHLAEANPTVACAELAQAKALIIVTGYHRRDRDVEEISATLR